MSERIVVEATGQARIEGAPDLPIPPVVALDAWQLRAEGLLLERLRFEVIDPTRLVRCVNLW